MVGACSGPAASEFCCVHFISQNHVLACFVCLFVCLEYKNVGLGPV